MNRKTNDLGSDAFILTSMQTSSYLQAQSSNRLADCNRAPNRPFRSIKSGEYSVARCGYLGSARYTQLSANGSVIVIHYLRPASIAQTCGFLGGADYIDR